MSSSLFPAPDLGVAATVVMDRETHGPARKYDTGEGLRSITFDDLDEWEGTLIEDLNIVSPWVLHVALYALQNPTPENIARALYLIGTSGDAEDWTDEETLLPLPVAEPHGWRA